MFWNFVFCGGLVSLVLLGVADPFMLAPTSGARFLGGASLSRESSLTSASSLSSFSRDSRKTSPTAQPSNV